MDEPARLAGWLILVGLMIAIAYVGRATEGKPDPQILYHWSTAVGGVVQDGVILLLVLGLARRDWALLALRRPPSIGSRKALRPEGSTFSGRMRGWWWRLSCWRSCSAR